MHLCGRWSRLSTETPRVWAKCICPQPASSLSNNSKKHPPLNLTLQAWGPLIICSCALLTVQANALLCFQHSEVVHRKNNTNITVSKSDDSANPEISLISDSPIRWWKFHGVKRFHPVPIYMSTCCGHVLKRKLKWKQQKKNHNMFLRAAHGESSKRWTMWQIKELPDLPASYSRIKFQSRLSHHNQQWFHVVNAVLGTQLKVWSQFLVHQHLDSDADAMSTLQPSAYTVSDYGNFQLNF